MAAGGYVYEKETATYDSSVFDTRLKWALHVFRKQIYAFLAASTRSATVNGDAHQYWDFDSTRLSDSYSLVLDDDSTIARVHTDQEWRAVSELMTSENYNSTDIEPIMFYTSDTTNYPALGCFFVGQGGEHLFFCNTKSSKANGSSSSDMIWKGSYTDTLNGSTSVLDYSRQKTYYKVCSGFVVMFSPSDDFSGNNPSVSGFRPSSCTAPVSIGCTYNGNTVYSNYNVLSTTLTTPFYFGFVVKRDQIVFLLGNDSFGQNNFKMILFGNILDNLSQENDTSKQATIVITDNDKEDSTGNTTSGVGRTPINMYYSEYCGGTKHAECANANGDCAMGSFGLGRDCISLMPAMCPTGTSVSSDIPYAAMQICLAEIYPFSGITDYMIKDGYGSKGFVNTDLLRLIPIQKVTAGATCQNGKFFMPAVYFFGGNNSDVKPSLSFIIGWDPSNEL